LLSGKTRFVFRVNNVLAEERLPGKMAAGLRAMWVKAGMDLTSPNPSKGGEWMTEIAGNLGLKPGP
jgi:hypothetical protein